MIVGLAMVIGGFGAGLFGALLGLGGGILIVPLLTLGFGLPVREAVGVSLVSVIVTSSAAASVYLERHVANLRLGMTLELFTAIGAFCGGLVAFLVDERMIAALFAALLAYTAVSMARPRKVARGPEPMAAEPPEQSDAEPDVGFRANLSGPDYTVRRLPAGIVGSVAAGIVSALLGVGGGLVKVPVMHLVMGVPLRVATATSNLMIGVTASAGAIVYLARGGIDPLVAGPTAIGVFLGASVGSRVAHRLDVRTLRLLFVLVLGYTAVQMARRAAGI
jgi:uncharacterized membrane protein YfcA